LLDDLEDDGRDLVAFADQVVARLREQLISALSTTGRVGADRAPRLTRAARRLAGLDVNRGAAGGYRLQLELALLEGGDGAPLAGRPAREAPIPQPAAQPAKAQSAAAAPPPPAAARDEQTAPAEQPAARTSRPAQAVKVEVAAKPVQSVPATPAPAGDALAELMAAWPQIVERVSRNPADRPLISACRPVEVSGATIVLGFPESQAFMRDIATRKQRKLEEGIGEVLGRAVAVRCVATNVELIPQDVIATSGNGEDLVEQARKIFADDLADVAEVD
jgi:hypothetical protein